MSRHIYRFASYLSAFTLGGYTYGHFHGNPVEGYRWGFTIMFGLFFYVASLKDERA